MKGATLLPARTIKSQANRRERRTLYSVKLELADGYPFSKEVFTERGDAEQFVEDVRRDDPEVAARLKIAEGELPASER